MHVYNTAPADTTSKANKFFARNAHKVGEAPVIYDEELTAVSMQQLAQAMQNKGYFRVEVDTVQKVKDRKMDVKSACSADAMRIKNIKSPINGDADALVMPDIEAGNCFYKTITLFSQADTAGVLAGTKVPVVLPSRGDDAMSKFFSLALAAWCCYGEE